MIRPAATRRLPLDSTAISLMIGFCLVLGLQQVAIKAIAADIAPLAQIALRSVGAALLVALAARYRRVALAVPAQFGAGLLVGLGFTLEFMFVALGLNYTLASHMAVFLYTSPIFAAIGLHLFVPDEQLTRRHWIGIALAFIGMVIAMAPNANALANPHLLIGDALGVAAGLSWAATTLVLRTTSLSEAPPVRTLFYQLFTAAALLLPASWLLGDLSHIHMTGLAWASMGFQTVIVSFGALLLWFWLLRRYLASRLGVFSFLSPLFGVLFGALLLGEPLSINFVIGSVAIVAGVVLVSR